MVPSSEQANRRQYRRLAPKPAECPPACCRARGRAGVDEPIHKGMQSKIAQSARKGDLLGSHRQPSESAASSARAGASAMGPAQAGRPLGVQGDTRLPVGRNCETQRRSRQFPARCSCRQSAAVQTRPPLPGRRPTQPRGVARSQACSRPSCQTRQSY